MQVRSSTGEIVGNRFEDNAMHTLDLTGGSPMVARNTFARNGRSSTTTFALIVTVTDAVVANNLFLDNAATAIAHYPGDTSSKDSPLIINNTILGGHSGIYTDHYNRARFVNNAVALQTSYGVRLVGQNLEWRHNLVFASNNGWGNTALVAGWKDTNIFDQDPLLDPTTFAPQSGSPCRDAGRLASAPADDLHGTARPQGGGGDLGAVEAPVH
jgi:hypothetical protein